MKKYIIALLIVSVFAVVSAQSYTQAFDSVFRHVDLSHTSTGILCERVVPPEYLPTSSSLANDKAYSSADSVDLRKYKHSVGFSAFCSFVGVSLKFNLKENLYLQTDFGGNAYINFLFIPVSPTLGIDFGVQSYLLYERKFPRRSNTYWIVGGGLNFAGVPHIPYSKQVSLKGGLKAIFGIEYIAEKTPFSIQLDTRWGYGVIYSTQEVETYRRNGEIPDDNPYHFLDYGIVFSLRYHFGKKK